jgi:hypothetical protein
MMNSWCDGSAIGHGWGNSAIGHVSGWGSNVMSDGAIGHGGSSNVVSGIGHLSGVRGQSLISKGGSGNCWGDNGDGSSLASSKKGIGVGSGVLDLGHSDFRGVNLDGVGGSSITVVVSNVVGGEWDSFWGNVGESSSDATSSISDGRVSLVWFRVTERSLTKNILGVVLGLGDGWDHSWGCNNGRSSDGRVSQTRVMSEISWISGSSISDVSTIVDDLCRTDCQNGSENSNDLHDLFVGGFWESRLLPTLLR